MEASFNTWTVIFLVAAIHGLALSCFFYFRKKGRGVSNILLGTFLLLFSLTLIDYVAYWTKYQLVYPHLLNFSSTFVFLFGPVLYLYVISIFKPGKVFLKKNLFHFLPFLAFLGIMLPFYIQSADTKLEFVTASGQFSGFSTRATGIISMKILHLLAYSAIIPVYTRFHLYRNKVRNNDFKNRAGHWINVISYCFIGFTISFTLYYVLVATIDFNVEYDYMISFAMTVFIFTVGYLGYLNPRFLHSAVADKKYGHSTLTDADAECYLKELIAYMSLEKPYKEGDLRLDNLADELSIPSHHLSQVINEKTGKNFFEFLNSYRIEEAKKILADPAKKDFKVLRVAFECGFNNKTSFNKAFKKEMGITPSEFRKKQINGGGR